MLRHVFRNALIPMVTALLPQVPKLIDWLAVHRSGVRRARLGKVLRHQHIQPRLSDDHGLVLLIALLWGLTYLITDILYTAIDPRIRLSDSKGA